jgi:hypothetical protein
VTHDAETEAAIKGAIARLRGQGYEVSPPPLPLPVAHCAICGIGEDENREIYGGPLIPVQLLVNTGEEGFSDVKRFYCDEHIDDVRNAVLPLGLGSHRHGSTTIVESDPSVCGGYGKCPHFDPESEYGEVYYDGPLHAGPA